MNEQIAYTIHCIRKFAEDKGIDTKTAYEYLKKYKGISFLEECYAAEHLLSFNDAVYDLTTVCHNNGGYLS